MTIGLRFLVAALAVLAAWPSGASAQTKLKWAHVYEVAEPYHTQAVWAADEIKKRSNGKYQIDVFPASTLGKETDINQGLTLGTVDIIYTGMAFAGRTYPPMSIASGPFVFRDYNHCHWRPRAAEVVATTRATAPRHRGSSRGRNRRTTDDDCLAEERRLALTVDGERLQDPLLALGLWGSTSPAVTVVAHR